MLLGTCVLLGLAQLNARLLDPMRSRRRQWYALTDHRCIWVSECDPRGARAARVLVPPEVQGVMLERHSDGTGTIAFALRYPLAARFEHIEDAPAVHGLVGKWMSG